MCVNQKIQIHITVSTRKIRKYGTISSISGDRARVLVGRSSACSMCEAAASCRSYESRPVEVYVADSRIESMHVGDCVAVEMPVETGRSAVWTAFGLPLAIVAAVVAAVCLATSDDMVAALCSLATLALYYGVLYALRPVLERRYMVRLSDTQGQNQTETKKNNRQL